eukprot:tig00020537_g10263.t1
MRRIAAVSLVLSALCALALLSTLRLPSPSYVPDGPEEIGALGLAASWSAAAPSGNQLQAGHGHGRIGRDRHRSILQDASVRASEAGANVEAPATIVDCEFCSGGGARCACPRACREAAAQIYYAHDSDSAAAVALELRYRGPRALTQRLELLLPPPGAPGLLADVTLALPFPSTGLAVRVSPAQGPSAPPPPIVDRFVLEDGVSRPDVPAAEGELSGGARLEPCPGCVQRMKARRPSPPAPSASDRGGAGQAGWIGEGGSLALNLTGAPVGGNRLSLFYINAEDRPRRCRLSFAPLAGGPDPAATDAASRPQGAPPRPRPRHGPRAQRPTRLQQLPARAVRATFENPRDGQYCPDLLGVTLLPGGGGSEGPAGVRPVPVPQRDAHRLGDGLGFGDGERDALGHALPLPSPSPTATAAPTSTALPTGPATPTPAEATPTPSATAPPTPATTPTATALPTTAAPTPTAPPAATPSPTETGVAPAPGTVCAPFTSCAACAVNFCGWCAGRCLRWEETLDTRLCPRTGTQAIFDSDACPGAPPRPRMADGGPLAAL